MMEAVLTFGLITTILAVVNGRMNVGHVTAFAIAAYFGAAIPIEAASMNPTRQLDPAPVSGDFTHLWAYLLDSLIGMLIAVGIAFLLRGHGSRDAQGAELTMGNVEVVFRTTKVVLNVDSSPTREGSLEMFLPRKSRAEIQFVLSMDVFHYHQKENSYDTN